MKKSKTQQEQDYIQEMNRIRKRNQRERDRNTGFTEICVRLHEDWKDDVLAYVSHCQEPRS